MTPRVGAAPDPRRTYRLRPGAYAVLPRGGSVLLTVQLDDDCDVQLPGGGIDPGESPIPALHREVFEETGWRISGPRRLGVFRRFVFMPEYDLWAEKVCSIYVARPVVRLSEPVEPNHMAIWADWRSAVNLLGNPGDRQFLQRYFAGSG